MFGVGILSYWVCGNVRWLEMIVWNEGEVYVVVIDVIFFGVFWGKIKYFYFLMVVVLVVVGWFGVWVYGCFVLFD